VWTATAEAILAKLRRGRVALDSATPSTSSTSNRCIHSTRATSCRTTSGDCRALVVGGNVVATAPRPGQAVESDAALQRVCRVTGWFTGRRTVRPRPAPQPIGVMGGRGAAPRRGSGRRTPGLMPATRPGGSGVEGRSVINWATSAAGRSCCSRSLGRTSRSPSAYWRGGSRRSRSPRR
jgi:hypothetical protein